MTGSWSIRVFQTELAGNTGQPSNDGVVTCACTSGAAQSRQEASNLYNQWQYNHFKILMQEKYEGMIILNAASRNSSPPDASAADSAGHGKRGAGALVWGNWVRRPLFTGFDYMNVSPAASVTGPGPNFSETSKLLVFHPAATNHGGSPSFYIVSTCGGNNAIR